MEGDLKQKTVSMMWETLTSLIRKISLGITNLESTSISIFEHVQLQITPLQYYGKDIDL